MCRNNHSFVLFTAKVTFRIVLPDGRRQELHGSVDKERSHQNVLLVKTPSLAQMAYQFSHQTIRAEVVVVTGRNQMSSNALHFDFIPNRKRWSLPCVGRYGCQLVQHYRLVDGCQLVQDYRTC